MSSLKCTLIILKLNSMDVGVSFLHQTSLLFVYSLMTSYGDSNFSKVFKFLSFVGDDSFEKSILYFEHVTSL